MALVASQVYKINLLYASLLLVITFDVMLNINLNKFSGYADDMGLNMIIILQNIFNNIIGMTRYRQIIYLVAKIIEI